jgi:hypothetical protein
MHLFSIYLRSIQPIPSHGDLAFEPLRIVSTSLHMRLGRAACPRLSCTLRNPQSTNPQIHNTLETAEGGPWADTKKQRKPDFIIHHPARRRHESVTCPSRIRPEPNFHHHRPRRTRGRTGVTAGILREAPPYLNNTSAEPKPSATRLKTATKRGWDSPI